MSSNELYKTAALRTLDEVLDAEKVAAAQRSLLERWRARVADEPAAGQPASATKLSAGIGVAEPTAVGMVAGNQRWRRLVIGVLAARLLAASLIFVFVPPHKSADDFARRGDEDRQVGNFAGAIADYSEAIRHYVTANPSEPKLVALYCSRGDVFMSSSEYGRAIADYTDALGLDARSARALTGRANAYRAEGDHTPAIADYVGAIQRDSDSDLIWVDRGDELQRAGDAAEASQLFRDSVEVFQRLTKAEPTTARWRRDLALSYFKLGSAVDRQERFADALEAHRNGLATVQTLLVSEPGNSELRSALDAVIDDLGDISFHLVLKKDFPRALEAANLSISLSPKKIRLYANQAHALMLLGRVDTARSIYLQYRGQLNESGSDRWETAVLSDFREMRKTGVSHPLMNEIEKRFGRRG
jgi:tetratricopeptide (TPR) repeat protein